LSTIGSRIQVVAGILQDGAGRVLIADRTRSHWLKDHWEFPGGKVKAGESSGAALRRELAEELGIEIGDTRHFHYLEHDYPEFGVAIDFFLVTEWEGTPDGAEGQAIRWVETEQLNAAMLLPADAPIIDALKRFP
jgi:8-oxo-dGTP diphosphatase